MAFTTSIKSTGGKKLEATLKKAEEARRSKVRVGFFSDAKYDDGQPIAEVAARNEFGVPGNTPERPFFRQSIAELERTLPRQLRGLVNPETMDVDAATAARIGEFAVQTIRDRIVALRDPANAETTVKRGDNPLIDSGEMLAAVDFQTE